MLWGVLRTHDQLRLFKVHIFWENLQNLHCRFVLCRNGQIYGGDFVKILRPPSVGSNFKNCFWSAVAWEHAWSMIIKYIFSRRPGKQKTVKSSKIRSKATMPRHSFRVVAKNFSLPPGTSGQVGLLKLPIKWPYHNFIN